MKRNEIFSSFFFTGHVDNCNDLLKFLYPVEIIIIFITIIIIIIVIIIMIYLYSQQDAVLMNQRTILHPILEMLCLMFAPCYDLKGGVQLGVHQRLVLQRRRNGQRQFHPLGKDGDVLKENIFMILDIVKAE